MDANELAEEYEKEDGLAIASAINHLLVDPAGRKFAWWLLQISRAIASQPYTVGDPYQTAFNCGITEVGNAILAALITTNDKAYLEFMLEMENERTRRAESLEHARADR